MAGFTLGAGAAAAGYAVVGFDTVGSTNAEALETVRRGGGDRLWFAALQQTEGRGRRGRPWHSPHGNLAASLLITPGVDDEHVATLGFVAGVALNRALTTLVPDLELGIGLDGADHAGSDRGRIALKWPNDVLADGAKVAGILLEAQRRPDGQQAIVIGIGVNVVAAPEDVPYPATSLAALRAPVPAEQVFTTLSECWHECYEVWNEGRGISEILSAWRSFAAGIGAEVAVSRNGETVRGIFETIDERGRLVVRADDGRRTTITAGDVHFGATATLGRF